MSKVTEAHIEARRSQITGAAWACFARKGYHQTTMQDIATEAGLSAGAIYRYYPSKEAVLQALNDLSQEMGRALVGSATAGGAGPVDALQVIGQTMFSYFNDPMFETITRVNIELWPELLRSEALREGLRKEVTFWRTAVTQLLSEARARGELREDVDPQATTILFICAWEGLRHFGLIDRDNFNVDRLIEAFRALFAREVVLAVDTSGWSTPPGWEAPPWIRSPQQPDEKEA